MNNLKAKVLKEVKVCHVKYIVGLEPHVCIFPAKIIPSLSVKLCIQRICNYRLSSLFFLTLRLRSCLFMLHTPTNRLYFFFVRTWLCYQHTTLCCPSRTPLSFIPSSSVCGFKPCVTLRRPPPHAGQNRKRKQTGISGGSYSPTCFRRTRVRVIPITVWLLLHALLSPEFCVFLQRFNSVFPFLSYGRS